MQIIECKNYMTIQNELRTWQEYSDRLVACYENMDGKEEERAVFESSSRISGRIADLAASVLKNDYTFYLCSGEGKIQGALVFSRNIHTRIMKGVREKFLYIELLTTHPTNLRSTITEYPDSAQRMKGIGSYLLQFAEELAWERELGVYLVPTASSISFYEEKHGYQCYRSLGSLSLIKSQKQIISQYGGATLCNLKAS